MIEWRVYQGDERVFRFRLEPGGKLEIVEQRAGPVPLQVVGSTYNPLTGEFAEDFTDPDHCRRWMQRFWAGGYRVEEWVDGQRVEEPPPGPLPAEPGDVVF